jgi:hypothetical protein
MLLDTGLAQLSELEDEPDLPAARDVNSDLTWLITYRQGFLHAVDGVIEQRSAAAYLEGARAGDLFWHAVTATRPYRGPSHFPGWTWEYPNQLPPALRYYARGWGMLKPIALPKFAHGGDRRSQAFQSRA